MNAELTEEDVKAAVDQIGGLKAPGPDGFQGLFYHSYWNIILNKVNGLVKELMVEAGSTKSLNSMHLVLVPKVKCPKSVSQYCLIGLCNYSIKILSKVRKNRLKPLLPSLISPMQNAFVADRQIQDNIGIDWS